MNYSITQHGRELDKSLYSIDEVNKSFTSEEHEIVLDFAGVNDYTFKTGSYCVFKTYSDCTFKTGSCCTFYTINKCNFYTGMGCMFKTGSECFFRTEHECSFDTSSHCIFQTKDDCSFNTTSNCVFEIGAGSVLKISRPYTFLIKGNTPVSEYTDNSTYILSETNGVVTSDNDMIEIKDKNMAILNMKHENELVRNLCKKILKNG